MWLLAVRRRDRQLARCCEPRSAARPLGPTISLEPRQPQTVRGVWTRFDGNRPSVGRPLRFRRTPRRQRPMLLSAPTPHLLTQRPKAHGSLGQIGAGDRLCWGQQKAATDASRPDFSSRAMCTSLSLPTPNPRATESGLSAADVRSCRQGIRADDGRPIFSPEADVSIKQTLDCRTR